MRSLRPFALVDGGDSWVRASHRDTFLDMARGVVELAWRAPEDAAPPAGPPPLPAGLAFDAECRLYRSVPGKGQVLRSLWRGYAPSAGEQSAPVELFEAPPPAPGGGFSPESASPGTLREPRGLAVDVDDRLFVAETGATRILVFDLWSRRLLRAVPTPAGTRPLDLATDGRQVWAALRGLPMLLRLSAREDPELMALPPEVLAPDRVAASPAGELAVLVGAGTEEALVVPVSHPHDAFPVPRATDLEWETDEVLVMARFPGEDFARYRVTPGTVEKLLPLMARGYDGMGIARGPGGRIGFWTANGFRGAAVARVRFARTGSVTTFRLDAVEYQSTWGRVFLDACVPVGSSLRVACVTTDEVFDEPAMDRLPPGNLAVLTVRRPDLSPPMPPLSLLPDEPDWRPLHRRESGRELAWVQPEADDVFVTYEAPVPSGPGRFLWVWLELTGNSRVTPKVRSLRVEHSAHDHLRRLPKAFSRDPGEADFLRRFLAVADSLVADLENRAAYRQALVDPFATPEDLLPWLASFLGMVLDERWSVPARRTLVAETAWLFRLRGTVPGLGRFLEIYLGRPVTLLEQFRLRGMGAAILGERGPATSRAVLGGGFRVGGAIADPDADPLEGTPADAFALHAHRFTVLVPGFLSDEQLSVVQHVLEVHRPAHTVVEVCALGPGMRLGRGLHLGISSAVGRTGGFHTLQLGASVLGRGMIVGRPDVGTVAESSRLGLDSRVG